MIQLNIGIWEAAFIVFLIVLLFGSKKLPDLARSVGRSARIFKSEVKEMKKEGQAEDEAPAPAAEENFWDRPENQPRQLSDTTQTQPQSDAQAQAQPSVEPQAQAQPQQDYRSN